MIPPWLERTGMYSWDIEGFGPILPQTRTPRLTIRWEYPDTEPVNDNGTLYGIN